MGKFWQKEQHNHHFPELNRRSQTIAWLKSLFNPNKMAMVMVAVTCFVGFIYLTQTNQVATQGYAIKTLDEQLAVLKEQNRHLQLDYIELQSMAKVIEEAENLNLVASNDVSVITPLGSSVALR